MSDTYKSIMQGLQEAVDDAGGKRTLPRHTITITPVKRYSAGEVKRIRQEAGLTQRLFAAYMGVSDKTVEAWESGRNHPAGAASRILSMMEGNRDFVREYPFVKIRA